MYEHFAFLRPTITKTIEPDQPQILKWEPKGRVGNKHLIKDSVFALRVKLNGLTKDQVFIINLSVIMYFFFITLYMIVYIYFH